MIYNPNIYNMIINEIKELDEEEVTNLTIKDIIVKHMKRNGFDGLCYANEYKNESSCACLLEKDFMKCGCMYLYICRAGYKSEKNGVVRGVKVHGCLGYFKEASNDA